MKKLITLSALAVTVYSQCIPPGNKKVDWFVVLQMPGGSKYVYGDASNPKLREIFTDLNDITNPIARTIDGIYQSTTRVQYLMYNDQPPQKTSISSNRGHTKGETAINIYNELSFFREN